MILVAGFVARMGEERLQERVLFGELVGDEGYSGGQEESCLVLGINFEGWPKAVQEVGRCSRRADQEAELFMLKCHETERRRAAERLAKAAKGPSTVSIS